MSRRVTAAVGAAALLAVVLPAVPAFAAAASTANLDAADVEVLPGEVNVFDITVANTEATSPILGGGRTVNAVRVILPAESLRTVDAATIAIPGWKVTRTSANGLERYDLEATGAGIAPGSSTTFALPATVLRPFTGDRVSTLQVGASSNKGDTYQSATGSLTTTVRTLKVTGIEITDRVGQQVADGTGTARQVVDTAVLVTNLAGGQQSVTANLASNNGANPDTVSQPAAQTIQPQAVARFPVTLTLGAVTADTLRNLVGTATSPKSSATTPRFRAERPFTVQVAPRVTLPTASFSPTNVNGKDSYEFTVDGNKTGTPSLLISQAGGSLVFRNRADGVLSQSIPLKDAVSFGAGSVTQKFTFTSTQLNGVNLKDGRYDALIALAGTDGNGYQLPADELKTTLADILSLDNVGPTVNALITLPTDRDGDRTTAARNYVAADGNAITVEGTSNDPRSTLTSVVLNCTTETRVITPVGTPTTTITATGVNYSARFEPQFGACRTFTAAASFKDLAGNVGDATNVGLVQVDNQVPNLDTKLAGVKGAVGRFDGVDPAKSSVMVDIADNTATTNGAPTGVIGGCDPRAYTVDGQLLVQGVYVLEGGVFRECTTGVNNSRAAAKPANNARYLRLTSDIARGSANPEPVVTYDPARSGVVADRIKDAAGNYALSGVQDTVNRLVPAAPVLVKATRAAGNETAFRDGTTYYTRFSGASDFKLTVTGGLKGDSLQLVKNGQPLGGRVSTMDGGGTIAVPVDAIEGPAQQFAIRFVSGRGVDGDLAAFSIVFDKTLPSGLSTAKVDGTTATVTFNEKVLGGNEARNWNVWETVEDEFGQPIRAFRGVNSVTGGGETRTVSADFTPAPYGGALYKFLSGTVYEDFAGNKLNLGTAEVVAR